MSRKIIGVTVGTPISKKYITEQVGDAKIIGDIDSAVDELIEIQEAILSGDVTVEEVIPVAYPVGSIYLSLSLADPAAIFGGTWEKLEGRYLVGSGDGLVAGDRVGEWSVKLTRENLPPETIARVSNMTLTDKTVWSMTAENKTVSKGYNGTDASGVTSRYPGGEAYIELGSNAYKTLSENNTAFSQEAITIMPPSIAVHMWRRIA